MDMQFYVATLLGYNGAEFIVGEVLVPGTSVEEATDRAAAIEPDRLLVGNVTPLNHDWYPLGDFKPVSEWVTSVDPEKANDPVMQTMIKRLNEIGAKVFSRMDDKVAEPI